MRKTEFNKLNKHLALLLIFTGFFLPGLIQADGVARVTIDMPIGPIAVKVIDEAIEQALSEDRELLIIQLNTPGGLDQSMRSICQTLLNTDQPTVVYVAPSGARAASAGLFVTYAAHFAAMSPGTNIGAAHVVNMGGEMDSVMTEKVQNDAVAYITAIAKKRDRNIDWAVSAVRESKSIDAEVALDSNVIDFLAENEEDLLAQIHGAEVILSTGPDTLDVAGKPVTEYDIGVRDQILILLTNPTIAFILFNLGWLGLLVELYNPGSIFPGVVGAVCLILAFFAFQQLPINYAGLGLIILAVIMFILEIKVTSGGALAVGGVLAMILGSLLLIDSPAPYLRISLTVIVTTVVAVSAFFFLITGFAVRAHRRKVTTGREGILGAEGEVRADGMAFIHGEWWRIKTDQPLKTGDRVRVTGVENMRVRVEKIGGE